MADPTNPPEGFADRIQRESLEEAQAVMSELARLRFRADQVGRVLRALKLPYPDGLQLLLSGGRLDGSDEEDLGPLPVRIPEPAAAAPPQTETEAPPSPPGPPKPPAPPTAPEADPPAGEAPTPAEPVASAQAAPDAPEGGATATAESTVGGGTYTTKDGVVRGKPTHPGPEAMPEHLRRMPVASAAIPVRSRIPVAEMQLAVLQDVRANDSRGGVLTPEAAGRLDIAAARVRDALLALEAAGFVRRDGTRLKHGVSSGKPGDQWFAIKVEAVSASGPVAAVPPPRAGAASPTPAAPTVAPPADAAGGPSSSSVDSDVITRARDWICAQTEPFTESQFAAAAGIKLESAKPLLGLFQQRKVVADLSAPGMPLWEYVPPREMGSAAERDHARAKSLAAAAPRSEGSSPVSGTGNNGRYSSHPATQKLCQEAERLGATIERTGSGHIIIRHSGNRVILGHTPGTDALDKTRKRLRAIGIAV